MQKIIIVQRVCTHYRADLFEKLQKKFNLKLLVSKANEKANNTKLKNSTEIEKINHKKMATLFFEITLFKKKYPIVICPGLLVDLIRNKPDLIICEGESNIINNIAVFLYSHFTKTPYIWWGLGKVPSKQINKMRKYSIFIIRLMLEKASSIISYSSYGKNFYQSFVSNKEKVVKIQNSIDTTEVINKIPHFKDMAMKERVKLNLEEKTVLLFVGAFQKQKNIGLLIDAYEELCNNRNDLALLMVGDGEEKRNIEMLVDHKRLKNVIFTGQQIEEVSKFFLMADLFILPGLGGLAINHAMAHGLPIISEIADGTTADLIKDGYNGYIFEKNDLNDLIEKIDLVLDDREKMKMMGINSQKMILENFNIEIMVDEFEKVINDNLN